MCRMITIIGGLTIDENIFRGRIRKCIGGPGYYISRILNNIGVKHVLISIVGRDFPRDEICNSEYTICRIIRLECENIYFKNIYIDEDTRIQECTYPGYEIDPDALLMYLNIIIDGGIIIISPVIGEFPLSIVSRLSANNRVLLDPQGYVRYIDGRRVNHKYIGWEGFKDVYLIKPSIEEFKYLFRDLSDLELFLDSTYAILSVTLGIDGSIYISRDECYYIPPYRPLKGVDPTGSGDVFMGGLAYAMYNDYKGLDMALFSTVLAYSFLAGEETNLDEISFRMDELRNRIREYELRDIYKIYLS